MDEALKELSPPARLLMGPGPINADPRVLRAMAAPLLGQFDPQFREYMRQTSELFRGVYQTRNRWTLLVDGTARAGIEAALVSLIEPGDKVLVPIFGRFGHLLAEISRRCGGEVSAIETEWGSVFPLEILEREIKKTNPKIVAICHGDTSTTMAQPLAGLGRLCRAHDAFLYVDATATLGGMPFPVDEWQIDVASAGLQKCLGGPPGSAPLTLNERAERRIARRHHVEQGLQDRNTKAGAGPLIRSNYFDLAMLMDYWSEQALNHHTEATSMLYAARECGRILMLEGLEAAFARHAAASRAMVAGIAALGLERFGDAAHKMANITGVVIPAGVDGDKLRRALLSDFNIEIGTSFGPLHGRIWRIGAMGVNARLEAVVQTLAALEKILNEEKFRTEPGAAVEAARSAWTG